MRLSAIALLVAALIVGGCASTPEPSRPSPTEQEAAATRFYADIDRDRYFAAVEEVFLLADGTDFEFSYNDNGNRLTATREWFAFLIFAAGSGTDTWTVRAVEKDGGIEGTVDAYHHTIVSDGSMYGPKESSGDMLTIAAGNLFWDRVDYVLGRRADWPSCDDREEELEPLEDDDTVHHEYYFIRALCHLSMKDIDPETGEAANKERDPMEEE